jgi:hypothetical protein
MATNVIHSVYLPYYSDSIKILEIIQVSWFVSLFGINHYFHINNNYVIIGDGGHLWY